MVNERITGFFAYLGGNMWYETLTALKKAINEVNSNVEVSLGAIPPKHLDVGIGGHVVLMRGDESLVNAKDTRTLDVTVYLEAWVREDSPELEDGYASLSELEMTIDKALTYLRERVTKLDEHYCVLDEKYQLMNLVVERRIGDSDSIRPLVGSQYTIRCKLYSLIDDLDIW